MNLGTIGSLLIVASLRCTASPHTKCPNLRETALFAFSKWNQYGTQDESQAANDNEEDPIHQCSGFLVVTEMKSNLIEWGELVTAAVSMASRTATNTPNSPAAGAVSSPNGYFVDSLFRSEPAKSI